jgi:hypothetical protein
MELEVALAIVLTFGIIGTTVLYWVIRQAVAGAITDVEARRAREEAERRRRASEQDRPEDDDQSDDGDSDGDGR